MKNSINIPSPESSLQKEKTNQEIVKRLKVKLSEADNINDEKYSTYVRSAIEIGDIGLVQYIIDKGVKLNNCYTSSIGTLNALHIAVYYGDKELVQYLIDKGAEIESYCTYTHGESLNLIDKGAEIESYCTYTHGESLNALFVAVMFGHIEIVKCLIDKGVKIDSHCTFTPDRSLNALFVAAIMGHVEIVQYLIDKGVTVEDSTDVQSILSEVKSRTNLNENTKSKIITALEGAIEKENLIVKGEGDPAKARTEADKPNNIQNSIIVKSNESRSSNLFSNILNSSYNILSSIAIVGKLSLGSYMKDMLPERISSVWGAVSNSILKIKSIETIASRVIEYSGVSAKAANALKVNFILALPVTIMIAVGKAISNFIKARKSGTGMLDATAESLYDTGAILAQSTAGVVGVAIGAAAIGGTAAPLVSSIGAAYAAGELFRYAKPIIGKFTAKIVSEVTYIKNIR